MWRTRLSLIRGVRGGDFFPGTYRLAIGAFAVHNKAGKLAQQAEIVAFIFGSPALVESAFRIGQPVPPFLLQENHGIAIRIGHELLFRW